MAETVTDASPQPEGTSPTEGGKPEGGNTPAGTGVAELQPEPPSYEQLAEQAAQLAQQNQTLNKNYSDSSRASQQDRMQSQNLLLQNQQLQAQLIQQSEQQAQQGNGFRPISEVAQGLIDGVVDANPDAVGQTLQEIEERGYQRGREAQAETSAATFDQQQRMAQSNALIDWGLLDRNGSPNTEDPAAAAVWQAYVGIYQAHQGGKYQAHIPADEIDYAGGKLNPHLLKEAQHVVLRQMGGATHAPANAAPLPAATGQVSLEASGSGTPAPTGRNPATGKNSADMLTEGERKTAIQYMKRGDMTNDDAFQRYYDKLPAGVRRVREKTGQFVTTQDLIESAASTSKGGPGG